MLDPIPVPPSDALLSANSNDGVAASPVDVSRKRKIDEHLNSDGIVVDDVITKKPRLT